MLSTGLKTGSALLCIAAITASSGCASSRAGKGRTAAPSTARLASARPAPTSSAMYLPPNAKPGECYAAVYMEPEFNTVTERVCVREESEMIQIIPAKYEWVEERVLAKEASTQLVEVPAQFEVRDHVVQTNPGHTSWIKANEARCVAHTPGQHPQGVFCLVSEPPNTMTFQTERQAKGPTVKKVTVPAEYQTVRMQKLVRRAGTRLVTIPAEFREFDTTVMVSPGRMEWQQVNCDSKGFKKNTGVHPVSYRNP